MIWKCNPANRRWESGHWWICSNVSPSPCSILYWHNDGARFAISMDEFSTLEEARSQAERWEAEGYRPEPIVITFGVKGEA